MPSPFASFTPTPLCRVYVTLFAAVTHAYACRQAPRHTKKHTYYAAADERLRCRYAHACRMIRARHAPCHDATHAAFFDAPAVCHYSILALRRRFDASRHDAAVSRAAAADITRAASLLLLRGY